MYIGNPVYQVAFLTDTFSGDASTTAFTMSVAPANTSSVLVAISGVVQDPSTYSVNGKTLTFTAAPPSATGNISARYLGIPASNVTTTAYRTVTEFTATASQTTFTPPSYTVGFISVYRNGVRLGSADYTASNGTTVVLTNAATAGDLVTTESFLVSSVLNAIPNTAASVSQNNLASGVAGTGPAFSAIVSSNFGITSATFTNASTNSKLFDTNTCFNNTGSTVTLNSLSVPAYAFCPNVAGYYQVNGMVSFGGSLTANTLVTIYKNGTRYQDGNYNGAGSTTLTNFYVGYLVYLNGSGDYIQLYGYATGTSLQINGAQTETYFQASMVRSA